MPLQPVGPIAGTPLAVGWAIQPIIDVLTGVMKDQPVTFADGMTLTGSLTLNGDPGIVFTTATSRIVPGATSLSLRNNANSADNLIVTNAGAATIRAGLTVTSGNVGLLATATNVGYYIPNSYSLPSAGSVGYASLLQPIFDSATTTFGRVFAAQVVTAAASYTMASGAAFYAFNGSAGAGSTIASLYGLYIESMTAGGTNNYGVYINAPSGGSSVNSALFIAGGGANITGTVILQSQVGIQLTAANAVIEFTGTGSGQISGTSTGLNFINNALNANNVTISDAGNVSIVRGSFNIQTGGSTSISTGVGVIHMSTANPATNASWIPIAYAGTTYFVPGWTTNSP